MDKKEISDIIGYAKTHDEAVEKICQLINSVKEECAVLADSLIFEDMDKLDGCPTNTIMFTAQALIAKAIGSE